MHRVTTQFCVLIVPLNSKFVKVYYIIIEFMAQITFTFFER